jgi:hypothetical protein
MPVFDRFQAGRREELPAAYVVPPRLRHIVDLLRAQGVAVDSLTKAWKVEADTFAIDTLAVGQLFEGHRTITLEGQWSSQPRDTLLQSGWYLVRTRQPLGVLAAYLLEPASEDGVVTWNFLDRELQPHKGYPIIRVKAVPRMPAAALP